MAAVRGRFRALSFHSGDARRGLPAHSGHVTILDILQFFSPAERDALLRAAAERVAPGGLLVIRSGLHDRSARFAITVAGDWLARGTRWMKAAPTHYPRAADFHRVLSPFGNVEITPLWGATPFNNHLIVLRKHAAGPAPAESLDG